MKLIKNYFNLYNSNLEVNLRKDKLRLRFKKLSSNKIYVSNGTFKHTNNEVIITLYVYNRQKINYTFFIKRKFNNLLTKNITNNLLTLRSKIQDYIKKNNNTILEILQNENNKQLYNKYNSLNTRYFERNFFNFIIKKVAIKYKKYFLYKQMLYINKSKFNYNYLSYLSNLLNKIYNKNVQFDIINLKYFYLNSDILTESILLKIRRDRRKLLKKLKFLLIRSKINKISKLINYKPISKNTLNLSKNIDPISYLILNDVNKNKKSVKKTALSLIKYKRVTGVRLEVSGRLTRRFTASRSLSKLRYKGNLIDIDSSYLGLSSVYLRGNLRSNVQYTKLKSKTRIGSFGFKG